MKPVPTYLLALCVIAGFCSRMAAHADCEPAHETACAHEEAVNTHEDSCCPEPCSEPSQQPCDLPCDLPCESPQDGQCPVEHHHHHIGCSHVMPLVADLQTRISFHDVGSRFLRLTFENDSAPDTPVFELDKPPLI